MKKKDRVKVGDRLESSSCGTYTILEKVDGHSVVQFDTGYTTTVDNHSANSGSIKDPLFPQLFGVGYMGVGDYVSRLGAKSKGYPSLPEYTAWVNMLQRCYYDKYTCRSSCRTYDNVRVEPEWHNFQNFAAWYVPKRKLFDSYDFGSPSLDKDILAEKDEPKFYGPVTCCLVPIEINGAFIGLNKEQGGIVKNNSGYYVVQKGKRVTGYFETIEEARFIKKIIKQEHLIELANKYQEVIEPRVYDKLCSWFEVDLKKFTGHF